MSNEDQSNKTENENLATTGEERYIALWVINKTNLTFTMESSFVDEGKFRGDPVTIPANTAKMLAFKATGRTDSPLGTKGWIRYSADQGKVKFTVDWNVPVRTDNTLSTVSEGEKSNLYHLTVENFSPSGFAIEPLLIISKK